MIKNSSESPNNFYLAIDIGASSGRHIIGYKDGNEFRLEEVYRFKNGMVKKNGDLVWDVERVFAEILAGIKLCIEKYGKIESLAIDTWGVDYVLLDKDNEILPAYAYRSDRTNNAVNIVHSIISPEELYKITGEQFQAYNTVYQLYADKLSGRLDKASDFLMMPEYFNYKLTGARVKEYTMATTGALINVATREFDETVINALELPKTLFPTLCFAGEEVGDLSPEIQAKVGGNITVKLCASHDTACAFEAIETEDNAVIISSGTWSLVGLKRKEPDIGKKSFESNFANEGGVGYFRYLKNVMGMWILNECCREIGISVINAVEIARQSSYKRTFDVNDPSIIAPKSMTAAIIKLLGEKVETNDLFASVFRSLAKKYADTISEIEYNLGIIVPKIYIVGGGAKNDFLNALTEIYCKKPVVAMPIEATALGNVKTQIKNRR